MNSKLAFILMLFYIFGCSKGDELYSSEELQKDDFILFGHSYGECLGPDCTKIFILKESELFFDVNTKNGIKEKSEFIKLPIQEFEKARALKTKFPLTLTMMTNTTFGCSDCRDQGAIILSYKLSQHQGKFIIDQDKKEIPSILHDYIDAINESIRAIKVR